MAKSANSKVVFVPMQLQSDVSSQLGGASGSGLGAIVPNESATNEGSGLGSASRVGILNSVADM
jgi:hypothetical protein